MVRAGVVQPPIKNSLWSESVAVGNEYFMKKIQQKPVGRVQGHSAVSHNGTAALKEPQAPDISTDSLALQIKQM